MPPPTDSTNPLGLDLVAAAAAPKRGPGSTNPLSLDYTAAAGKSAAAPSTTGASAVPVSKAVVTATAPKPNSLPPGAKTYLVKNATQSGQNNDDGDQGDVYIVIYPYL